MSTLDPLLAALPEPAMWSSLGWTEFDKLQDRENRVAILPVYGFADWGLGRPLDLEEILGSAVLRGATEQDQTRPLILPPLRHALGPYPHCAFGVDFETAVDLIVEIAAGVRTAGFRKLLLLAAGPWNVPLIDVAGRQARVQHSLQVFLTNLAALGLDLHPVKSPSRDAVQWAACACLGKLPQKESAKGDVSLVDFRPGNIRQPPPLKSRLRLADAIAAGEKQLASAAAKLGSLLCEMRNAPPLADDGTERRRRPATTKHKADMYDLGRQRPVSSTSSFPRYRERYLPAMTFAQIRASRHRRNGILILPTASIEQHGPHLPVGVDAMIGEATLAAALNQLPAQAPVFVGPPITYGMSDEHLGFPGTVSVSPRIFRRGLEGFARQAQALGFSTIAVYNTHGGNSAALVAILREMQTDLNLNAVMVAPTWKPPVEADEAAFGIHAGHYETALMLAIAPHLVRMKKAVREFPARLQDPGELRFENAPATTSWMTADVSKSGVMGDATKATAAEGNAWLDASARSLAEEVKRLMDEVPGR